VKAKHLQKQRFRLALWEEEECRGIPNPQIWRGKPLSNNTFPLSNADNEGGNLHDEGHRAESCIHF